MPTVFEHLKVILGLESRGFGGVRRQVDAFTSHVGRQFAQLKSAIAGYFTVQAGAELVRSVVAMAEHWKDVAAQTGLSTDEVQRYNEAFKRVGTSVEEVSQAFDVLIDKRREALEKGGEAARIFQSFGISDEMLQASERAGESGATLFRRLNPDNRQGFIDFFGSRRAGKFAAAAKEFTVDHPVSIMPKADIDALDDTAKRFHQAVLDFKIAAAPFVISSTKLATEIAREAPKTSPNKFVFGGGIGGIIARAIGTRLGTVDAKAPQVVSREARIAAGVIPADAPGGLGPDIPAGVQPVYSLPGAQREEQARKMGEAFDAFLLKTAPDQRGALRGKIDRDLAEADRLERAGKFSEAISLRTAAAKNSTQLAELLGTGGTLRVGSDQLAAVGGMIGGAAAGIDPSLTVQQDMKSILQKILNEIPQLRQVLGGANPLNQIQ